MIIGKAIVGGAVATMLGLLLFILALVPLAAGSSGAGAATAAFSVNPSTVALDDIPAVLLPEYVRAAQECSGLPWPVLAGIGKVESNHGRFGGAAIDPTGQVTPPIIGIRLDGSNGTSEVPDTDDGLLDGDVVFDRAVGPFQFLPASWTLFGVDGNADGVVDPHNIYDAVPAMVRHLCPSGSLDDVAAALFAYNRSLEYVDQVLSWASRYTGELGVLPVGGYALPLAGLTETQASRPHHDYPAWDVAVPVGTPVFAMVAGTVVSAVGDAGIYVRGGPGRCGNMVAIEGVDGIRYTYCHLSAVVVQAGEGVVAGQPMALTGGQPGTRGAGNTTGAHLHLSMTLDGERLCPQSVLLAILRLSPTDPRLAPSSGCVS